MSYGQSQSGVDAQGAAVVGAGAYVVGLLLSIVAVEIEIIDELAFYSLLDFEGNLLAHMTFHELGILTESDFLSEFIPMTIVMILVLVGAGYLAASRGGGNGPQTGAAITVGYLTAAVIATIIIIIQFDSVDTGELLLILFVTGVVYPIVFGGIGGLVAGSTNSGSRRSF